jgi:hypothetical protein
MCRDRCILRRRGIWNKYSHTEFFRQLDLSSVGSGLGEGEDRIPEVQIFQGFFGVRP